MVRKYHLWKDVNRYRGNRRLCALTNILMVRDLTSGIARAFPGAELRLSFGEQGLTLTSPTQLKRWWLFCVQPRAERNIALQLQQEDVECYVPLFRRENGS